jgi:peptidoglycan-N-acetylmuramic acid deacetylase
MRAAVVGLLLAAIIAAAPSTAVFAQGHPAGGSSTWLLGDWRDRVADLTAKLAAELEYSGTAALPDATVVRRGPRASGAVALTFDDGYNVKACASIARTLRRNDAVGTFFINGHWLKREPDRWRRILEGMEVANHTRSHRDLTQEPRRVVVNQIRSNEYLHETILGRPMLKVLRPPYGAYEDRIGRIAGQLGYHHIVLWNVDSGDWKPKATPKRILQAATGAPPGSIVLMHCAGYATARALPRIVRHYQRRGIEVAGLSTVLDGAKGQGAEVAPKRYGG